jgi:molybdopterin molybdotransferase
MMVSACQGRLIEELVFGKSTMISTLAWADGCIVIPEHIERLDQKTEARVYLFAGSGRNG